jgi:hypothetical protein
MSSCSDIGSIFFVLTYWRTTVIMAFDYPLPLFPYNSIDYLNG